MPPPPPDAPTRPAVPGRARGDACPGSLRLHEADDGALARVRVPGGLLTAPQALALAAAAEELGDGRLDLTSRGNVQLRGLDATDGPELARRLREAGLFPSDLHERMRNVVATAPAGLDGRGFAPVDGWVRELDALLCADPDTARLSGRFLFALDDGRGDVAALAADVTLIALSGRAAQLRLAGALPGGPSSGAWRIAAGDAPRAAVLAALEFLGLTDRGGARVWRVRELSPEDADALNSRLRGRLEREGIGAEPVESPRPLTEPSPPPPGVLSGPDGRRALSVAVRLGRADVRQWRLLAATAERGTGELRVTPWRGAVLPGFPGEHAAGALDALEDAGFITDAASPWLGVGACAGRPGCAKSLADVRADACAALTGRGGRAREDRGGRVEPEAGAGALPLPVHWSGCERRCGHPAGRWVDVVATGDGYRTAVRGVGPGSAGERTDGTSGTSRTGQAVADAVASARRTNDRG
nr:precorrin-3B synthase [Wenjunlia tyrosinilytica]